MSMSEAKSTQYDQVTTQTIIGYEERLTSLDQKIESKMRKITTVFRELCAVNANLNHLNRQLAFANRILNFFSGTSRFFGAALRSLDSLPRKIFSNLGIPRIYIRAYGLMCYFLLTIAPLATLLRIKFHSNTKASLEQVREKNHNKLTQYDQEVEACSSEFCRFLDTLEQPILASAPDLDKTRGDDEDPEILTYLPVLSVTTSIVKRAGCGITPAFIQSNERAQKIFERAMSNRYLKELYIEAMLAPHPKTQQIGSWLFRLQKKEKDIDLEFGAFYDPITRGIYADIAKSDDEVLSSFVFELTNAVSTNRFEELRKCVLKGELGREEYAEGVEAIEHEGAIRHHAIMTEVIKETGWSDELDEFRNCPADFARVWPAIKDGRHTEACRKQWDMIRQHNAEEQQAAGQSPITSHVEK